MSDPRPGSVVVVGASAGGVQALTRIAADLPEDLPAPVFVVLHVGATSDSALPEILTRAGPLPAEHPRTGEPIEPGRIYVAPPDRHLLIEDGMVSVARGPRENLMRPAIDPLFRSAAVTHGSRVIAVILSGTRNDGAAGVNAVSRRGGVVIVQDPDEAVFPEMPMNAIAQDHADFVLPLGRIVPTVVDLIRSSGLSDEEKMRGDGDDEITPRGKLFCV